MKPPIDSLYPDLRRLMRALVGADLNTEVVLQPGDRAATLEGRRGYHTNKYGGIVRYPRAYGYRTVYHRNTLHVLVGATWATKVWLRLKTPPAGLKVKLIRDGLLVTNKRTKFQCVVGDGVLLHKDYRRRIKRVMAEAIARTKPKPVKPKEPHVESREPQGGNPPSQACDKHQEINGQTGFASINTNQEQSFQVP